MSDEISLEKIAAKEKEKELKEAEDRLDRIKNILGSVQNGWSVALYRRNPGWAEGHLETKRIVGDGEELDLDYIAQQWGGEVIQVRIQDEHGKYVHSTEIPFRSFPPKVWGKEIPHPNYRHQEQENRNNIPPPRDPLSSIDTIVGIIERLKGKEEPKSRDSGLDLGIIELLLRHQMQSQSASSPLGAVEQFIQIAEGMKSLKGLFGNDEIRQPAENDMMGSISGILDTVLKIRQSGNNPTPKIAPPRPHPQIPMIGPVRQPQIQPNPKQINEKSLADQLASLDPKSAAENVLLALDKMDDAKREAALQVFFNHLGIEEEPFDESVEKLQNGGNGTSTD